MQYTFVICVLMFIAITMASASEGLKHKRSLSLITRLLSNGVESSQRRCTGSQRKPLKQYEIFVVPGQKNIVLEPVPDATKEGINNEDYYFMNSIEQFLASDTFQATTQAVGNLITKLLTGFITEETNTPKPQYVTGLIHQSTAKTIPKKILNIKKIEYETPKIHYNMPSVVQLSPIIAMPRKYSYEQIRGDTVQKFSLDKNADVIVTETKKQPPRPAYVDDRIKDIILGAPSNIHSVNSRIADAKYHEASIKPNVVFSEKPESFNVNMLPNTIPMYRGEPIVILGDTSNNAKTSATTYENEINKIPEHNIKDKPRGDIPEYI